MCHYLGGGLHGRQKRVKAQSESSKSVVNSVLISREMPVFPGFLEIIRVVVLKDEETFALELQSLWKEKREEKPKQNQRLIFISTMSVKSILLIPRKNLPN